MKQLQKIDLVSDNDGHDYAIPFGEYTQFYLDLEKGEEDYYAEFENKWGEYRINGSFQFWGEI